MGKMESKTTIRVAREDLIVLMDAFDSLCEGNARRLDAWSEEYGITEDDLDAAFKRLGKEAGRDFGIL